MIEIYYKNGDVKQFEYKGHYKKVVDEIMQAIEIKKGITHAKLLGKQLWWWFTKTSIKNYTTF